MEAYSKEWELEANRLSRSYSPLLYPCKKCNHPVVSGYCCSYCGDSNPSSTKEQDKEYEKMCNSKRTRVS
jgi:hypothetical protein